MRTFENGTRPVAPPDAMAFSIRDARVHLGCIGNTKIYELIAAGLLQVNRTTGRTLVLGDSLRALLATPPGNEGASQ
jgi:hypothetical protein